MGGFLRWCLSSLLMCIVLVFLLLSLRILDRAPLRMLFFISSRRWWVGFMIHGINPGRYLMTWCCSVPLFGIGTLVFVLGDRSCLRCLCSLIGLLSFLVLPLPLLSWSYWVSLRLSFLWVDPVLYCLLCLSRIHVLGVVFVIKWVWCDLISS